MRKKRLRSASPPALLAPLAPLALLLAGGTSCASAEPAPSDPLPFHVAVIPLEEGSVRVTEAPERDGLTDMTIQPDPALVSNEITVALDQRAFTRATLLVLEEDEGEDAGTYRDRAWLERAWVEEARSIGADMILECELEYAPEVWQKANGNFWLNLPLFALGGPFTYFVKDRTYYADVELIGRFYDLRSIDDQDVLLGDRFAQVFFTNARFTATDLNFMQRAAGRGGKYVLSFVIPSGFLAKDGGRLERRLDEIVIDALSDGFAQSVLAKRDQALRAEFLAPFYLDPDDVAIERLADDKVRIAGTAHLLRDTVADRMNTWRVGAGARAIEGSFSPPEAPEQEARGRYVPYPFVAEVDVEPGVDSVQLELEAGTRDRFARSYTFPIR